MGIRQSPSHCSSWNLSFNISIMDFFLLLTFTLVLSLLNIIYELSAASASTNRFSFLGACSISKVENFSFIFWAIALYGARLGSFREKLSLVWQTTKFESPNTLKCLTPISRAVASSIRQASYSIMLFEQGNSSLNDSATTLSSSWYKTTPTPSNWVVKDPSNFITHYSLTSSVMAISPGTSSSSGNSSSPGNSANRYAIAWLFTALVVLVLKSYCDNCNNH